MLFYSKSIITELTNALDDFVKSNPENVTQNIERTNEKLKKTPAFLDDVEIDHALDDLIETTQLLAEMVDNSNNSGEFLSRNHYQLHALFKLIESIEIILLDFELLTKKDIKSPGY